MLELSGLSAGYAKNKKIIHDISLQLERGKVVMLLGPNGSGKSTLIRSVLGMLPYTDGEVKVDGISLSCMSRKAVARTIGYLPQGIGALDMTVAELVLTGRYAYSRFLSPYTDRDREVCERAMRRMNIAEFADTRLDTLSGGMRQRAYLAMSVAGQAEYLLLDEPTTYLDISHQLELVSTLRELAQDGRGVFCVMHDLPLAFSCADLVAVMDRGRIVSFGGVREVYESNITEEVFGVKLALCDGNVYRYDY